MAYESLLGLLLLMPIRNTGDSLASIARYRIVYRLVKGSIFVNFQSVGFTKIINIKATQTSMVSVCTRRQFEARDQRLVHLTTSCRNNLSLRGGRSTSAFSRLISRGTRLSTKMTVGTPSTNRDNEACATSLLALRDHETT